LNNIAIIPARGGSKGIPQKNVKIIAGKPLISWTVEQALAAKSIDRVVVSTDCERISAIAIESGAEVPFIRPAHLADDVAATEPVLLHALDWLKENEGYTPDNVVLLQATSPVRAASAIDEAVARYSCSKADSLLSVCEFWHFLWENHGAPKALYDYEHRPRRQDIKPGEVKYKENGSIYISSVPSLLRSGNRLSGKIELFVMSEQESFEIDTPLDWKIVETILNAGQVV
jgi:CMP-N,N'-diacetyllegionaminic acid synthase